MNRREFCKSTLIGVASLLLPVSPKTEVFPDLFKAECLVGNTHMLIEEMCPYKQAVAIAAQNLADTIDDEITNMYINESIKTVL